MPDHIPSIRNSNASGEAFIKAIHNLLQAVKIHQENNQLVIEAAHKFKETLTRISSGDEIEILLWRGRLYYQGEKILSCRDLFPLLQDMLEYFTQRSICGFLFRSSCKEASQSELILFAQILNRSSGVSEPFSWIGETLKQHKIEWIEVLKEIKGEFSASNMRRKEFARQTYSQAVAAVQEVTQKVAQKSSAGIRKARRLAQSLVDVVLQDESIILGLTTIRDYDDYTFTHSVNVALLSSCLGNRIGLSRILLEQLTVCGMFHDLGKVEVPKDILMKPDKLNSEEWEYIRKHPLIGVTRVLRMQASRDLRSRLILGPFEHHLNENFSGYPETHFTRNISLFGKILRITDTYDALTSNRIYRFRPLSPDEGIRWMWENAQTRFNPLLLKAFITLMGPYPIGTVIKLDTGELGMVTDYTDELDKTRPQVVLLQKGDHGKFKTGKSLNLGERDETTGLFKYNIMKGFHPSVFQIQPANFLLQESI
jgi:HD-GYP domain-containing protein (c-di-GMP phosphodiesterase class II)